MWLCHDNEVRATEACLSDWVIAWGLLPPPSFITVMIVFSLSLSFFSLLSLSFSVSPSVSLISHSHSLHLHSYPFSCSLTLDECCCVKRFPYSHLVCESWIFPAPLSQPTPTTPIICYFSGYTAATRFLMQVTCQTPTPYYLLPLYMWRSPEPQPETFDQRHTWGMVRTDITSV